MDTRQVDVLSEYLCPYRVLEWADQGNGKSCIEAWLGSVNTYDFGVLNAWPLFSEAPLDVFRIYANRAAARLETLAHQGVSSEQVPSHLYFVRNGLAHGKSRFVVNDFGADVVSVADDISIVKLLARMVVEGAT
jgi:hypothetical protein